MMFRFERVQMSTCGMDINLFGRGDVLIMEDPWRQPMSKVQEWRLRKRVFRMRMKLRKRLKGDNS
jgi:hypothetical protein